jgi:hypothetical protein
MATLLRTGALVVSVDLPTVRPEASVESVQLAVEPLVELFTEVQVSATWGISCPAVWNQAEPLLNASTPQELAILGDESWAATFAGRERFCRGLALHQAAAAKIGYRPTTFTFNRGSIEPYVDLAQKRGITATRSPLETAAPSAGVLGLVSRLAVRTRNPSVAYRPEAIRFGLWDLRPSVSWPGATQAQRPRLPMAVLRRGLDEAIELRGVFHLVLDAQTLAIAGARAIRGLERFFAYAVRRREQTRLAILTMQETAVRLSSPRACGAARSILHSRAA